ncbi:AtuA-related protein [Roseococcus sp.]|uniref:AtuA-related protein n=1 Tax=Roseococcus sp. TaxID=2109646 RepID=UPI003BA9D789
MTTTVLLHEIAHSRAGDKGNRLNMSLMPYKPEHYAILAEQITADRVLALFTHRGATGCVRYDLPNLQAFNFVVDEVLEGGVNGSLNLDGHGKSNSFRLLALTVELPDR